MKIPREKMTITQNSNNEMSKKLICKIENKCEIPRCINFFYRAEKPLLLPCRKTKLWNLLGEGLYTANQLTGTYVLGDQHKPFGPYDLVSSSIVYTSSVGKNKGRVTALFGFYTSLKVSTVVYTDRIRS